MDKMEMKTILKHFTVASTVKEMNDHIKTFYSGINTILLMYKATSRSSDSHIICVLVHDVISILNASSYFSIQGFIHDIDKQRNFINLL